MEPGTFGQNLNYLGTIGLSAVLWTAIYLSSKLLSPLLFPKVYRSLEPRTQTSWNVHMVSFAHALIITFLAFAQLQDPALQDDKLFGFSDSAALLSSLASGYFLWDFFVSLHHLYEFGWGFVIHAFVCFFVYFFSLRPFLLYFSAIFLLFEVSTIFLNLNWFFLKADMSGSRIQVINNYILMLTYFSFRIVFGFYSSYIFFLEVYARFNEIPLFLTGFYSVANFILNGLNIFWMMRMSPAFKRKSLERKMRRINGYHETKAKKVE